MTRIFHITISPISIASRIFKEASAARKKGFSVTVLGLGVEGLPKTESRACGTELRRLRLLTRGLPKSLPFQIIKMLEWLARLTIIIARERPDIIHCHSITALTPSVVGKWVSGAKLLYDAHELETERHGLQGIRQRLAKILEKSLIRFVDHTIVVGPRILAWYREAYPGLSASCIKNIPEHSAIDRQIVSAARVSLREKIGAGENDLVLIYSGGFVPGRGIEFLCSVFAELPQEIHIAFLGYGPLTDIVTEHERRTKNIHFVPAVPQNEVIQTLSGADIGVNFSSSEALNNRYSMPNKLFEYCLAGLPILVDDKFEEMGDFVEKYDCGWLVPLCKTSVAELLQNISPDEIEAKRAGARKAGKDNRWSVEAAHLLGIYDRFLVGRSESNAA